MKSPFHHIKHPEWLFEHFHNKIHHAFAVFALAIIGMLWGASHLLTPASASWQWGWFITSDFWDQNPTNANIMYALFGNGTPGSTAYTRLWDSSCVPTNVVNLYSTWFAGWTWIANTIYILNSGNYTLTMPIALSGSCTAVIAKGNVIIKPNANFLPISISGQNQIILDNIKIDGQNLSAIWIYIRNASNNITINNIDSYNNTTAWIQIRDYSTNISLSNSRLFNNQYGCLSIASDIVVNNSQFYNNTQNGIYINDGIWSINNSQFYNNTQGIYADYDDLTINNSIIFNNIDEWIYFDTMTWTLNNVISYNNGLWLYADSLSVINSYGTTKLFGNITDILIQWGSTFTLWTTPPIATRAAGVLDTWTIAMDYDRVTNPQNGSGQRLLSWTNRNLLTWRQTFDGTKKPIRYIFGWNILKQIAPVWYNNTTLEEYNDYTSTRYIAEPDSTLPIDQQALVNQYFWSWSTFTQNWQTNNCSLSAFQVKTLNPWTFTIANNKFEDHTIYILTGGEYRAAIAWTGNGFIFNGNCIALVGNNDTEFTKSGMGGMKSLLYADNKHNIIIDNIKADAMYYNNTWLSPAAQSAIKFDGASNNSTINNVQAYNASAYGIYLGLNSHHNTIINTQAFNNSSAGIHLYYASNYNVINNTQTYNNINYGIWFANGSNRNTMNNFQAYNNAVWVFWDLTTQENVLNRAAIYNNSDAGIYFKNASGNALNDVKIYHNAIGIKSLYSSIGNQYYGEFKVFDNTSTNFDGTNGNDSSLFAGTAWLFAYAGVLTTGTSIMTCLDGTNPTLSGNGVVLLTNGTCTNMWFTPTFISTYNTYVNYMFGLDMYKQKIPVRYDNGNILITIPSQYDATKYIAEVFAIRDDTPESVTFVWSWTTPLNTRYTTNIYTAGVLNVTVPVTLSFTPNTTSGYLTISWTNLWLTGMVSNGDTIKINLLTRTWYNETVTGLITIWTVTTEVVVTTRGLSQTPTTGSFAFTNLTSIPLNTFTGSTTTIAGLETGVTASITFIPITTSGRLEIYSGSTLIALWTTGLNIHNGNQVKVVAQSSTWYGQITTGYITIGLGTGVFTLLTKWSDTTPPTTPTIVYPLSGESSYFVSFQWDVSVDTGSWLDWYTYEIADDINFAAVTNAWFITTTTATLGSPNSNFTATNGTYYLRIRAKDNDGNYSARSNSGYFKVVNSSIRNITNKTNVNLWIDYDSNEIILTGIKPGLMVWASVSDSGTISKNGSNKGTGTFVQNGDIVYITLKSSTWYNKTLSSVLTIANRTLQFSVKTKIQSNTECTLSYDDEANIQAIFDSLVESYSGDINKYNEFLTTMQSMLGNEIDFSNDCNLQYLQNLINTEIEMNIAGTINTGNHIAPNCKEYPVSFDFGRIAYTSPVFKSVTYFANRDSLVRYIDSNNPGDCHVNTYGVSSWSFVNINPNKHIALNGKIYIISSDGQWYYSNDFLVRKYFTTISALRIYVDGKNIPQDIRNHQVDTNFTPQNYIAPNNKEYKIYKTDRWYMSYKLMKVRYFSTLADIQSFISRNNPR